ncbi:hypothetical protein [Leptolyngbya sp. 7M]|uniref:hypothetical protein n=1 Tax=Leptolyngbya sp. 7M TaxID=2812896 RepID=UPI001B8D68C3|nr:hypothetical protein [Leptolyngbya sp. 7M]QYO68916.1 hypothetical protein JVX88_34815 [Leptolyngbya sp. 7M]
MAAKLNQIAAHPLDFMVISPHSLPTSQSQCKPRLAVALGDPAGIGPEVVLKALADPTIPDHALSIMVLSAKNERNSKGTIAGPPLANSSEILTVLFYLHAERQLDPEGRSLNKC